MSEEIGSMRPNPYIFDIENRKKRRPRLAHDLGAGAKCKKCGDKCPGFELHFWRKICMNCRCGKDDHEVEDDDEDIGQIVIGKLFDRPARTQKEELEYCHGSNLEIVNEETGKAENVKFDWVPPNVEKTLASRYMENLPPEKRPIAGSEAAKARRRQLEQQLPLYDMDAAQRSDSLPPEELQNFQAYMERIRTQVAGQGTVQEIVGGPAPSMAQPLQWQTKPDTMTTQPVGGDLDANGNIGYYPDSMTGMSALGQEPLDQANIQNNNISLEGNQNANNTLGQPESRLNIHRPSLRQQFLGGMVGEPGGLTNLKAEDPAFSSPYGGTRMTAKPMQGLGSDNSLEGISAALSDLGMQNKQPENNKGQLPSAVGPKGYRPVRPGHLQLNNQTAVPGQPGFQPGYQPGQPGYQPKQSGKTGYQPGQPGFIPGQPGYQPEQPGFSSGQPGFSSGQPGEPGFPSGQPGKPGFSSGQPGEPGFPSGQPGEPGFPSGQPRESGFPSGQPGDAGFPSGQPGEPGFSSRQPREPGFSSGQPGAPGFLSGQPGDPGFLSGQPREPGFSSGQPGAPGFLSGQPGDPGFPSGQPGDPGFPSGQPGEPGFPSRQPDLAAFSSGQPGKPGFQSGQQEQPGFTARQPGQPGYQSIPGQPGSQPGQPGYPADPSYQPGQTNQSMEPQSKTAYQSEGEDFPPPPPELLTYPTEQQRSDTGSIDSGVEIYDNVGAKLRARLDEEEGRRTPLQHMIARERNIQAVEAMQAPYGAQLDTLTGGMSIAPGSDVTVLFPGESQIIGSQVKKHSGVRGHKSKYSCQGCSQPMNVGDVAIFCERAGEDKCWHPACFSCFTCKELLADLIYFYKDGKVFCGRHFTDAEEMPRCKSCDELIFGNSWTRADGFDWHIDHFCCNVCDTPMAGQRYVPDTNGYPYCLPCYMSYVAKMCEACEEKISPEVNRCGHRGYFYHATPQCFKCYTCQDTLLGKRFKMSKNWVFCSNECIQKAAEDLINNTNPKIKEEI